MADNEEVLALAQAVLALAKEVRALCGMVAPVVNVDVHVPEQAAPSVMVNVPEQPPAVVTFDPVINVAPAAPAPVAPPTITVQPATPAPATVTFHEPPERLRKLKILRNRAGEMTGIIEEQS